MFERMNPTLPIGTKFVGASHTLFLTAVRAGFLFPAGTGTGLRNHRRLRR